MYHTTKLLSTNNYKTKKGEKLGYKTYILYLSPYKDNSKGVNLCPHASAGCAASCLFKSGFGGMYESVANGRRNKTEWYLEDRAGFMAQLDKEVGAAIKRHAGKEIVTFRLNGTSDIRWEKIKVRDNKNIFDLYPGVQFYDYTKNPLRFEIPLPKNYHLTFSRSETNDKVAMDILARGFNVAMVFAGNILPRVYKGYRVVDGDENDLTFIRPKGVIVGLKYKFQTGKGADNKTGVNTGFVITL